MKRFLFTVTGLLIGLMSHAQVNLAGVYEGEMNDNVTRKRMYANLDFLNEVPDFTQIFKEKKAPMKILPADFMNAGKLKKNFTGQSAPGFIRYNSKTLFSSTEELKLTNPRVEDGVLTADWVNNEGAKGKCFIIVNPDKSIRFLGLTTLPKDLGPDNLVLTQVENKLPQDKQPYVTVPELLGYVNKRYHREILWKLRIDSSKGMSGVKPSVNIGQVRRIGNNILLPVQFQNKASKEARPYFGAHNPFERNELAVINGSPFCIVSSDHNLEKSIGPNETAMQRFTIVGVPLDAQKIDLLKIQGRAQYTHSTENNPYGDFEYVLTDVVLPELQPSQGGFITDSDIQVNFDGLQTEGKNLIVNFTLINRSVREKQLTANEKGIARTQDGEEFQCTVNLPKTLMANDLVKGKMIIPGAKGIDIKMARIPISISERNLDYKAMLQF